MSLPAAVYMPRHPQDSDYYHCIEDYYETFVQSYDEQFSRQDGFSRPYVEQVSWPRRFLYRIHPIITLR